jgi:hypothetical protein
MEKLHKEAVKKWNLMKIESIEITGRLVEKK